MKERIVLYADAGKVLTNGEIYGTQIFLADGVDKGDFWEITEAEYEEIMKREEEEST